MNGWEEGIRETIELEGTDSSELDTSASSKQTSCDSVECNTQRGRSSSSLQTVVTLSKLVTPQAMQQCLQFLYTGTIDSRFCELQVQLLGSTATARRCFLSHVIRFRRVARKGRLEDEQIVYHVAFTSTREDFDWRNVIFSDEVTISRTNDGPVRIYCMDGY
ncbi:hypothetical protein ANN_01076 [Periplaneta americana]|uniref:Uncharacterized protein n=1 Tax=Periplaneta americana TaxID=6978 RepID=A0ABQ8TVH1_PERAM|nr:hypothetical protein ANN_01076 [Periplaneta americana]